MSWKVNCICHFLQSLCSYILPTTLRSGVTCCIDKCLDITIPRSDPIKRLQRKHLRKYGRCKRRRRNAKARRIIRKPKEVADKQTMRVLDSDFLANVAYNHRIAKAVETSNVKPGDIPDGYENPEKIEARPVQPKEHNQDYRDVKKSRPLEGLKWWAKMQENAALMPPLEQDTAHRRRSDCSSMSLESVLKISDTSIDWNLPTKRDTSRAKNTKRSLNRRARRVVHYAQPCEGTKSESKIDSARREKFNLDVMKSASTKTIKLRSARTERKKLSSVKRQTKKSIRSIMS